MELIDWQPTPEQMGAKPSEAAVIRIDKTALNIALKTVLPALSVLLGGASAHAFGVGVQPATVEMSIKNGERARQTVTLGNVHTEKTITLQLSLADWTLDENGELLLSPPGESPRSGADWVRFSPAQVTLEPETKQDVTVEVTTPYKVGETGDHRFALLATTLLPEDRAGQSGVWSKYQLASLFYLTLGPAESLAVVEEVEADESGVTLTLRNDGNAHARVKGTARLNAAGGETVGETEINTVLIEGQRRELAFGFGELPSGAYEVEFDIDNVYAPQNDFRPVTIAAGPVSYVAP